MNQPTSLSCDVGLAHGIGKQVKGGVVFGRSGTRSMSALPCIHRAYTRPRVVFQCTPAVGRTTQRA